LKIFIWSKPSFEKDVSLVFSTKEILVWFETNPQGHGMRILIGSFFNLVSSIVNQINIYVLHVNDDILIVALYVDDLVIIGGSANLILGLKRS
jgi:hypothetical protein